MRMGVDDDREVERYRVDNPVALSYANRLARKWQRWGAIWAAKHYGSRRGRVSIEDVEQAGRLGVLFASREYDESKGKFPSWAKYYIMAECTKLLARGAKVISMPRDWKETLKPVMIAMDRLANNGNEPDFNKALNSLDLGETRQAYIRDIYESAGREAGCYFDERRNAYSVDVAEEIDTRDGIERMKRAADKLPRMHREVFMDQMQGISTRETSERLGITLQTLHNYRRASIEWIRYEMGLGPRPREKQSSGNIKERIDYAKFA